MTNEEQYYADMTALLDPACEYINVHNPAGLTPSYNATSYAAFQTTSQKIMIKHIDCHDGCWIILCNSNASNAMNTQDELDDVRPMRFTKSMNVPILRSNHAGIMIGHGNVAGNPSGTQTYNGWGTAMFQQLPSDW